MTGAAGDRGLPSSSDIDAAAARQQQVKLIGKRIRMLRRERMTLAELARASNLSIGLLSRLENGTGNPSFAALSAIARALDDGIESFFEEPADQAEVVITPEERITLLGGDAEVRIDLLSPHLQSRIVALLLTLSPGYEARAPAAGIPGQQFETVLSGAVELHIDYEIHRLEEGDSVLFEASRPHRRRNLDLSSEARLMVCTTELRVESFFPDRSASRIR